MSKRASRRELMRPAQLLGLAFIAALFAGVVTVVTMGFFQAGPADMQQRALLTGAVVAGITFIVVLVVVALLLLAVDPAQMTKTVDRPVLLPPDGDDSDASGAPDARGPQT